MVMPLLTLVRAGRAGLSTGTIPDFSARPNASPSEFTVVTRGLELLPQAVNNRVQVSTPSHLFLLIDLVKFFTVLLTMVTWVDLCS